MITLKQLLLVVILFTAVFFGCNDDFAPYANTESGYMVYCILDNRLNTQYVALQKIHVPGGEKKMNEKVRVAISYSTSTNYFFRDTAISGVDDYSLYYLPGLKPWPGMVCRLTVTADSLEPQYADLIYCGKGPIPITVSKNSDNNIKGYGFSFFSFSESYFMFDIFIDYVIDGSETQLYKTVRVPMKIKISDQYAGSYENDEIWRYDFNILEAQYPENPYERKKTLLNYSYNSDVFYYALKFLLNKSIEPSRITIKKAYLVFSTYFDPSYDEKRASNFVNYSLRLDESFYRTNLFRQNGYGYGLFGAVSVDTTNFKLDNNIIREFGYKDGQK